MNHTKLSVVLATYNEESNIKDCLSSVKDIADEIIVVDGKSVDKTAQIAQQLGAKVISVANNPQFHKNKQIAINSATGEWILQLDGDERVSPELAKEIIKVINDKQNKLDAYYLPRKNWFLGRFLTKGGAYPDPVLRLFRRGKGNFTHTKIINNGITTSNVHAQIEVGGQTERLNHNLIHYGDLSFSKYLMRFNRYTQLEAENLVFLKFKPNFLHLVNYIICKPIYWFIKRYIRHRGYVDGYQGFLFALLSAMHYPVIYLKLLEHQHQEKYVAKTK